MASAVGNWIRKSFKRKESRDIRGDDATSNLTSVAVQVDQAATLKGFHRTDADNVTQHNPRNVQHLRDMLRQPGFEPNRRDDSGNAPLHAYVLSSRHDKVDLVVSLLTHSSADVNLKAADSMTALHFAVMVGDVLCTKALIAFGADILAEANDQLSVLDLATSEWISLQKTEKVAATPLAVAIGGNSSPSSALRYKLLPVIQPEEEKVTKPANTGRPRTIIASRSRLPFKLKNPWGSSRRQIPPREDDISTSLVYEDKTPMESAATQPEARDVPSPTRVHAEDSRDFDHSMRIKTQAQTRAAKADENEVKPKPMRSAITSTATPRERDQVLRLLYSVGAQLGGSKRSEQFKKLPEFVSFGSIGNSDEFSHSLRLQDYIEGRIPLTLYEQLMEHINHLLENSSTFESNPDEDLALRKQQKELKEYEKTRKHDEGIEFGMQGGSRVLVLDGGGMKGLVEIEVLAQLEEHTGKKVTELFDWIIGTSTGGIVALALVYAEKSLRELRQLYFKLKDQVFSKPGKGLGFDSKALEDLLKETLGETYCMNDVPHPKVLIAAVNKKWNPPQLHFFNNCFDDKYSTQPIWKVARYTSAAPLFFTSFENYVDGGVLANNPCDYGLTAIQNFYQKQKRKLPISLVVSLGSGIYPMEDLGDINAQELLYFGPQLLQMNTLMKRAKNLIALLTNALVESEIVARNCEARCREQGIPFFRFSPTLDETISAGEVDNEKLITMIIRAKQQTWDQGVPEVLQLIRLISEANRKRRFIERRRGLQEAEPEAKPY